MKTLSEQEMRAISGGEIIIDPHTLGGPNCMGAVVKRFIMGLWDGFGRGWNDGTAVMSAK